MQLFFSHHNPQQVRDSSGSALYWVPTPLQANRCGSGCSGPGVPPRKEIPEQAMVREGNMHSEEEAEGPRALIQSWKLGQVVEKETSGWRDGCWWSPS